MQGLALQLLVVVMMLAVGLELTVTDLAAAPRRAGWFAAAIAINLLIVPLGAWALAEQLDISSGWTAGMVLLAAAPGGPVGPVLGRLGGADLGFSTGLMVLLGVVGLVSAPLTVSRALGASGGDGLFWPMFSSLLVFQILPLVVAMVFRHLAPRAARRLAHPARLLSNVLLAAIVVGLAAGRGSALIEVSPLVHAALVGAMLLLLAPMFMPSASPVLRGLATVTAVRNISVALLLAANFFDDTDVEVAILVCAFWMLVLPVLAGLVGKRLAGLLHRPAGAAGKALGEDVSPVVHLGDAA